jgi:hypothetical protein
MRLRGTPENLGDRSAQWAVSLLRDAAPYQSPTGHKDRVWIALSMKSPVRTTRLRVAFAFGALAMCGLFTSAALAQWPAWLANAIQSVVSTPPSETSATPTQEITRGRHFAPSAPNERPATPVVSPPVTETAVTQPSPTKTELPPLSRTKRATKTASSEDLQPLLEAIRALRVEHNPVRARSLLTAYLDHHPKSELAEEALVTLIQAAAAHHDSDVQALAARYFKTYPRGTFRGTVEKTLNANPDPIRVPAKNRND